MKLTMSMVLTDDDRLLTNEEIREFPHYRVDGTLDELRHKLTVQLALLAARHAYPDDEFAMKAKFKELKDRWLISGSN
jgi:hypothetical protein